MTEQCVDMYLCVRYQSFFFLRLFYSNFKRFRQSVFSVSHFIFSFENKNLVVSDITTHNNINHSFVKTQSSNHRNNNDRSRWNYRFCITMGQVHNYGGIKSFKRSKPCPFHTYQQFDHIVFLCPKINCYYRYLIALFPSIYIDSLLCGSTRQNLNVFSTPICINILAETSNYVISVLRWYEIFGFRWLGIVGFSQHRVVRFIYHMMF